MSAQSGPTNSRPCSTGEEEDNSFVEHPMDSTMGEEIFDPPQKLIYLQMLWRMTRTADEESFTIEQEGNDCAASTNSNSSEEELLLVAPRLKSLKPATRTGDYDKTERAGPVGGTVLEESTAETKTDSEQNGANVPFSVDSSAADVVASNDFLDDGKTEELNCGRQGDQLKNSLLTRAATRSAGNTVVLILGGCCRLRSGVPRYGK